MLYDLQALSFFYNKMAVVCQCQTYVLNCINEYTYTNHIKKILIVYSSKNMQNNQHPTFAKQ